MKTTTTTTDNKLIAEFMEIDKQILSIGNSYSWSDSPFYFITEDSKDKVMNGIAKYSKYRTSWDWIMPVIKKIREIVNVELCIDDYYLHEGLRQRLNPFDYDIDSIYKGAIEFIKWHNDNK